MSDLNVNIMHVAIDEHGLIFNELLELTVDCLQQLGIQGSCSSTWFTPID